MASFRDWMQRPNGLIKGGRKRKHFEWGRECFTRATIQNQSYIITVYLSSSLEVVQKGNVWI